MSKYLSERNKMRQYQEEFINLYGHFRDSENRERKANKIAFILDQTKLHDVNGLCLDVGCSNGIITKTVSRCFRHVVGVDLDMEAMKFVETYRLENTDYAYGDAMFLPFSDESFDALICSQTYEHVPSDLTLFAEIARVIKKKGVWIFSGPNQLFPFEFHHRLFFLHWLPEKWADCWVRSLKKGDSFYERFLTYWQLKKIFSNYRIIDAFRLVLKYYGETSPSKIKRFVYRIFANLPKPLLKVLSPFTVNFNWILVNDKDAYEKGNSVDLA